MIDVLYHQISRLLRMIASRVRNEVDSSPRARPRNTGTDLRRNNDNLKTVALLPVSRNVPIESFARKLHTALEGIGAPTSYLDQVSVSSVLGRHAFTRMGKLKTAAWLADQEQRYKIVLYVVDSSVGSSWTQTCIRQADYVLVVGLGDDPSIGEYERLLLSMKTTQHARKARAFAPEPNRASRVNEGMVEACEELAPNHRVHMTYVNKGVVHGYTQHIHVQLSVRLASMPKRRYIAAFTEPLRSQRRPPRRNRL